MLTSRNISWPLRVIDSVDGGRGVFEWCSTVDKRDHADLCNVLDQSMFNASKARSGHGNDQSKGLSIASSQQSPYIWDRSIRTQSTRDTASERSSEHAADGNHEYHGRAISQSVLNTVANDESPSASRFASKRSWNDNVKSSPLLDDYQQHIHLPACHEIFYEQQADHDDPSSIDRPDAAHTSDGICVLYLGPNKRRGFEEDQRKTDPSNCSLLTLKSHSSVE